MYSGQSQDSGAYPSRGYDDRGHAEQSYQRQDYQGQGQDYQGQAPRPEQGYGGYGYGEQGSQRSQGNESHEPAVTENFGGKGFSASAGPAGYSGPHYGSQAYQEPGYQENTGQSYPEKGFAGGYGYAEQDYPDQGPGQSYGAHGDAAPSYQDQGYSTFGYGGRDRTGYENPGGYEERGYDSGAGQPGGYRELAPSRDGRGQIRIPTPRTPLTNSPFPLFPTKEIRLRDGNTGGVAGVSRYQPVRLGPPGRTYCLRGIPFGWSRVAPFAERRPPHRPAYEGPTSG